MMVDYATIQVRRDTKRKLEAVRRPGESFDAALRRTLKLAESAAAKEFFDELYAQLDDRASVKPLR